MKLYLLLAIVIALNTVYWGWSEVYIHKDLLSLGLLKGLFVSVSIVSLTYVFVTVFLKRDKS